MHTLCFLVLFLTSVISGSSQTAASAGQDLPKESREVFAAAAPFYDFTALKLKPWHLKANYQLYNEKGKHPVQGTYEYWWVSPQKYRSTWTRSGAVHTDWHTEGGKYAYELIGEPISLFENRLQAALLSPLPSPTDMDPEKFRLDDEGMSTDGVTGPCFTVVPLKTQIGVMGNPEQGPFSTYCFESQKPVLRSAYSFERVFTQFGDIAQTQGKYIAREVNIAEGKRKILSAKVEIIDEISPSDQALIPPTTAARTDLPNTRLSNLSKFGKVEIDRNIMLGLIIKKPTPIYPGEDKKAHIQGNVVLNAVIGSDGKIHDLRVVSAPSASLAASSFLSVSQWEYIPYILNGEPVPVETTIRVIFSLDR